MTPTPTTKAPKIPKAIDLEITQADLDAGIEARARARREQMHSRSITSTCRTCPTAQALMRRGFGITVVGIDESYFFIGETQVNAKHPKRLQDEITHFDRAEGFALGTYRLRDIEPV